MQSKLQIGIFIAPLDSSQRSCEAGDLGGYASKVPWAKGTKNAKAKGKECERAFPTLLILQEAIMPVMPSSTVWYTGVYGSHASQVPPSHVWYAPIYVPFKAEQGVKR